MIKIPQRKTLSTLKTRTIQIERPTPGRKLHLLKPIYKMPQKPTRTEEMAQVTAELNERLVNLQTRVAEWKALRGQSNQ